MDSPRALHRNTSPRNTRLASAAVNPDVTATVYSAGARQRSGFRDARLFKMFSPASADVTNASTTQRTHIATTGTRKVLGHVPSKSPGRVNAQATP